MNKIARNASFNLAATFVALLAGIVTSVFTARLLGPHEYGLFSLATWLFAPLGMLVERIAFNTTAKFVSELEGSQQRAMGNRLTLVLLGIQGAIGLVIGACLAIFRTPLAFILGRPDVQPYLILVGLWVPIAITSGILRARLAGFQKYDLISVVLIASSCINLIFTLTLLYCGQGVNGLIWLIIGIIFFQLISFSVLVWKPGDWRHQKAIPPLLSRRVAQFCGGILLTIWFDAIVWLRSETIFLGHFSTQEQIGYYGLAFTLAGVLVTTLPTTLTGVLMPALSNKYGSGDRESLQHIYATTTKYAGLVSFPICLGCIAIAGPAIQVFYGSAYVPVAEVLQILLAANAVIAISGPGSALFLALGKPGRAAWWQIPIAILDLTLAFILVPPYGALGAATANAFCQILGVVAGTAYLLHFQRFRFPFGPLLRILVAGGFSAALAFMFIHWLPNWEGLLLAIVSAGVVYIPALILTKAITPDDFALLLSLGEKLPGALRVNSIKIINALKIANEIGKNGC